VSKVAIVTDTIACLPPEIVKQYGIKIVPIGLVLDGKVYRDQVDIDNDEFWRRFESLDKFSTNAALPGDWVNAFKEAAKETNDIACTMVTKALSATYQTAVQAREIMKMEHPEVNIEVFDSRTAAGAQGYVVIEGARAAEAGKSLAEVVKVMQDMIPRAKWICGMDTTKHLIKIGRAPRTIPVEVFLQVKPMIAQLHNTGVVEDLGAARNKDECFQKMVDTVAENTDVSKPLHVMAHYTSNIEDGCRLLNMMKSKYNVVESYLTPYSAVMCGTTGPCNAIAFYS
jgi:DegV family protein with EDD domain